MPYKNKEDKLANQSFKQRAVRQRLYHKMGLEQVDGTVLRCSFCLKETSVVCAHIFRHWPECPILPQVADLLKVPVQKLMPKPRIYKQRPTEAELMQRRTNVEKIANHRRGKPQNEW